MAVHVGNELQETWRIIWNRVYDFTGAFVSLLSYDMSWKLKVGSGRWELSFHHFDVWINRVRVNIFENVNRFFIWNENVFFLRFFGCYAISKYLTQFLVFIQFSALFFCNLWLLLLTNCLFSSWSSFSLFSYFLS